MDSLKFLPCAIAGAVAIALSGVCQDSPGLASSSRGGDELRNLSAAMVPIPGKDYSLCKYEVTRGLWAVVMGGDSPDAGEAEKPVYQVSWFDCQKFLEKLNALDPGHGYRLPTLNEWEHACRAGGKGACGKLADGREAVVDEVAWYVGNASGRVQRVGQKLPNAFGLYDMLGNASEWVSTDVCGDRYYLGGESCNPAEWMRWRGRSWCHPSHRSCGLRVCAGLSAAQREAAGKKAAEMRAEALRELPSTMVPIPGRSYSLCKYEVTQILWEAVMGGKPLAYVGDDLPVSDVSWDDCQQFLAKLNERCPGHDYRLPTEEEWEHACRAGSTGKFGNLADGREGKLKELGWYHDSPYGTPDVYPVGAKKPNAFGLYDMHGNVAEWTSTPVGSAWVIRGGGLRNEAAWCEAGCQNLGYHDVRSPNIGFRLCGTFSAAEREAASAITAAELEKAAAAEVDARSEAVELRKTGDAMLKNLQNLMVRIPGGGVYMCKYEVTQGVWASVMGTAPSFFKGADLPVENVSWDDCQEFLAKLNEISPGHDYRLPTRKEWEYACRAGSEGLYGRLADGREGTLGELAWYYWNSDSKTHPVGQKAPNAFGLYDMHGNVAEWTSTATREHRDCCGGGFSFWDAECASDMRRSPLRDTHDKCFGFRICYSTALTEEEREALEKTRAEARAAVEKAMAEAVAALPSTMVQIPGKDFCLCKYEVTQALWEAVTGENPARFKGVDNPVNNVSWDDCQAFLVKLNEMYPGRDFRLPSEEEWEYACRAGSTGWYGLVADGREGELDKIAWYKSNSGDKSHPVGQKEPNAFGLYDMHGNVSEWTTTVNGYQMVYRGGNAFQGRASCRVDFVNSAGRRFRSDTVGLRLCGKSMLTDEERAAIEKEEAEARAAHENVLAEALVTLPSTMVQIPGKDYCLCKYEVTQALWEAVTGENPARFKDVDNPVNNVSWIDCRDFLKKLNEMCPGRDYRLPTEEEWEYACRAGSTGKYGALADGREGTLDEMGWYNDNANNQVHVPGLKKPNAFGLYDMHGNVGEWTSTPQGDDCMVCRGGDFAHGGIICMAGVDKLYGLGYRSNTVGLRLCCRPAP